MDIDNEPDLMNHPFVASGSPEAPGANVIYPKVDAWRQPSAPAPLVRPPGPFETPLSRDGARWLRAMPISFRPLITAKRHPHIINRMALLWGNRLAMTDYLDSLLITSRTERRGFAMEVLSELCDLQQALLERAVR